MGNYSKALEEMRRRQKEEAGKYTAPSSLLSGLEQEKKSYANALSEMRRRQNIAGIQAKANEEKAKQYQKWVDTRTQDVIKAELAAAKKEDGDAKLFSGEWWKNIGEEIPAMLTGRMNDITTNRTQKTQEVEKLEDELNERRAYDYASLTRNKDFAEKSKAGYSPQFNLMGESKINLNTSYMTDDQRDIYYYLKATEGEDAADEYYDFISFEVNARRVADAKKGFAEIAEKSPVGASVLSVGTGALRGFGYLGQAADYILGNELDPNAWYNFFSHATSGLREPVSTKINEKWGKVASYGYDLGMSMADFLAAAGMTGGGTAASILLGSGAAADTTIDALERGVDSKRAFWMGTAAGVIETVTEKVSVDKLLEDYSQKGIRQFILSNMISEASEETASEIANTITDVILAEDKSYWSQKVQELKRAGYSEGEAFALALGSKLGEVGLAALGGAISGGTLAGGRVVINSGVNAIQKAGDKAADRYAAYRGQEIIRQANASDAVQQQKAEQQKYTVLPTVDDMERAKARESGEVFDIGYERPYTGTALTAEDMDLDRRIEAAETLTEKTGLRHGATEEQIADMLELSRAIGRDVEFYTQKSADGKTVQDGFYNRENGHIYINVNAKKKDIVALSHELTHTLEGADVYDDLVKLATQELTRKGTDIKAEKARLTEIYKKAGVGLENETDVMHEIAANYVEKYVLGTKASIMEITKSNPSLARRIKAWLDKILSAFRHRSTGVYSTLSAIQQMYDNAITSAAEEAVTAEGMAEGDIAAEENAVQAEESEVDTAEKKTPVKEPSERSEDVVKKAETKPAAKEKASERETGKTQTAIYDEAEEFMRQAEEDLADGRITEEEFEAREAYYDEWVELGYEPKESSKGYKQRDIRGGMRTLFKEKGQYSVSYTTDGRPVAVIDEDILVGVDEADIAKTVKRELGRRFSDGIWVSGRNIAVNRTSRLEYTGSKYTNKLKHQNKEVFVDKMRAAANLDDIVLASTDYINEELKHSRRDEFTQFAKGNVLLQINNNKYTANVVVGITDDSKTVLYDVVNVQPTNFQLKTGTTNNRELQNTALVRKVAPADTTISHSVTEVNPNDEDVTKMQYSVSETEDTDYMSAVERGDTEAAQRMVDEAAKRAGYTIKAYHGTTNMEEHSVWNEKTRSWDTTYSPITVFKRQYEEQVGHFFAADEDNAGGYGSTVYSAYLMFKKPLVIECNGQGYDSISFEGKTLDTYEWAEYAKKQRYDGVIFNNVRDGVDYAAMQEPITEYVVFDSNRIKSADPVTYDNNGNVIPLSQRFNVTNRDIRYSVSETETEESTSDAYSTLPERAKSYLRKVESTMGQAFDKALELGLAGESGTYKNAEFRAFVKESVRPITNEYLTTSTISRELLVNTFNELYKNPEHLPAGMFDQAKMDALGVFENIIAENWNELNNVRRYAEQANRDKAKMEALENISREDAKKRFEDLKSAQKFERKVLRRNLLTDDDMIEVGKLLRKEISLANLNPAKNNVEGIRVAYEAKLQTREAEAAVNEYKRHVKARMYAKTDSMLDTMFEWKDKSAGFRYQRETLERNIQDIVSDKAIADQIIREIISPVHQHEADAIRWKKKLKERVKSLGISSRVKSGDTVSESFAVQYYGEAADNIARLKANPNKDATIDGQTLKEWEAALANMWAQNPGLDEGKIKKAAEEFRAIYEEIFEEMNNVLLDNGYPPVAYRSGYFPHFTGEEETVLAKFGRLMGIKTEMMALPTTINGLTENFKPGKAWFGHAQERKGSYTTYDAITGLEQYMKGAADVIFHTEDIQKLRALANRIRYNASDEGVQRKMNEIENNETLDDADKEIRLAELRREGGYALSNFVAYLDEYTNKLANKKSRIDRGIESLFGRRIYVVMNNLESRVAANMIVANLGSAMTNAIPVNQAAAQLGWGWMLKGLQSTYKNVATGDSLREASTFLTNRRGYDPIVNTFLGKVADVGSLPMEVIDTLASEMIVRAAYAKNLDAGMTSDEALYQADLFAASVMADRSKGAMPLIFENKNPLIKLFTQFQLEVNNEFSVIFKDIPRRERKKWTDAIAIVLFKYFLGAFLYNELYELIVGRRAALDPIGIAKNTVEDITAGKDAYNVIKNFGTNTVENLPFVGGLLGGGRVPISSALPDWDALLKAIASEEQNPRKRAATIWKEASAPLYYLLFPAGGGAVKKVIDTIDVISKGGKYTMDAEGQAKLQYPMFLDTTADKILNPLRSLAFGTTSLPTAQDWIDNDFKTFGVNETAVYDGLKEVGVSGRDAYGLLLDLRGAEKTETNTKKEVQIDIIRNSGISDEGKLVAYYGLVSDSDKEKTLINSLNDLGADAGVVTELMMDLRGAGKDAERINLLITADLEEDEKRLVYESKVSDEQTDTINAFRDAGMDFDTFLEVKQYDNTLTEDKSLSTAEKATAIARWVKKKGFTQEQAEVIEENIRKYTRNTTYDDFTSAGLDDETAYKLTSALADLEPLEGKSQVSELQKCRAVIDTVASPVYQMDALKEVMSESTYKKTVAAYSYGIEAETYIAYLESLSQFDLDGNGSLKQDEVEAALRAISGKLTWAEKMTIELTGGSAPGILYLNDTQLAVLWQLSGSNWNPKNNPYDTAVGEKVKALLEKDKK